jgi:hypothetical protein
MTVDRSDDLTALSRRLPPSAHFSHYPSTLHTGWLGSWWPSEIVASDDARGWPISTLRSLGFSGVGLGVIFS